jgi:hypothetical protein
MTSPSEDQGQPRPLPCPECQSTRGYVPVGKFRSQCLGCNSLLKNEEVTTQDSNEETR